MPRASGNAASIEERAHSATANLRQAGGNNVAGLIRNGFVIRADVTQQGVGNAVKAVQGYSRMDQPVLVEQRGLNKRGDVEPGDGGPNAVALIQNGSDNVATVNGAGLVATISQDTLSPGYGNVASIAQR